MMKRNQYARALCAVIGALGCASAASATTIATFSSARPGIAPAFNMFDPGSFMAPGIADLAFDGHFLVNVDAGITGASMTGINTVYLPIVSSGAPTILTAGEVTALLNHVNSGGNLIVQGDIINFSQAYNNVAAAFGVQYVSGGGGNFEVVPLTGSYAPLTNGPFGSVNAIWMASGGAVDPLVSGGTSLLDWEGQSPLSGLLVLPPDLVNPGSGTVIFLNDVNTFANNTSGGYGVQERALWRNMFAIPTPGAMGLLALAGLVARRRRR